MEEPRHGARHMTGKKAKHDQNVPNARNSKHHQEEHKNDAMTEEKFIHVLNSKAGAQGE